jgi:hypothetical protein
LAQIHDTNGSLVGVKFICPKCSNGQCVVTTLWQVLPEGWPHRPTFDGPIGPGDAPTCSLSARIVDGYIVQ